MNNKSIVGALPLIANALGRKYGIKVHIGGDTAYTNGRDIHLPALPAEMDEDNLKLVRGYIDHESAHLRITDFEAIKNNISAMEKRVWNILEDVFVEQKLGEIYPGCKQNFIWLAKKLFLTNAAEKQTECPNAQTIFNWLLCKVRSQAVPELSEKVQAMEAFIEKQFPDLITHLDKEISTIPTVCNSTGDCLEKAKQIVAILEDYIKQQNKEKRKETLDKIKLNIQDNAPQLSHSDNQKDSLEQLQELLDNPDKLLSTDSGEIAGEIIENLKNKDRESPKISIAKVNKCEADSLSQEDIFEARKQTAGLRAKLTGLLQSTILTGTQIGRTGKIVSSKLASLVYGNSKIFAKFERKQGFNTAIHILLDSSGSMQGEKIRLAILSTYALASALQSISGLSLAITSFPGEPMMDNFTKSVCNATVNPLLCYKERLHRKMKIGCNGSTPMAETLWWVLQEMPEVKESRKIVLIISDGVPDRIKDTIKVIETHKKLGHEVYGIGIQTNAMSNLLAKNESCTVWNLNELPNAMFNILKTNLTASQRRLL